MQTIEGLILWLPFCVVSGFGSRVIVSSLSVKSRDVVQQCVPTH